MSNNINTIAAQILAQNAQVLAQNETLLGLVSGGVPAAPATTAKAAKAKPAKATTTKAAPVATGGPTFKEAQAMLVGLKASGGAPAGMTVRQAIEAGLVPALGVVAKAPKAKGKAAKGKKAKKVEGTPFAELRAQLVAHKAAGLIPAGVSVRVAQAEGLMDETGAFTGSATKAEAKPAKKGKAKAEKAAAKVDADAPAKVRAAEGPRDSLGRITSPETWATREALADKAKFTRQQIDMLVDDGFRVATA